MPLYLDETLPVVAIHNNIEVFNRFLSRSDDPGVLQQRYYYGDRTLLWLGDPKAVFVTSPIPHAEYLRQHWGYPGTHYFTPADPSPWLSLDILREAALLTRLVEYARVQRTVQIVPYATTPEFLQLVEMLRQDYGLKVLLPESPAPEHLWVRDYIDTKTGFRVLASHWLPDVNELLPRGIVCRDMPRAAAAAHWFGRRGYACVVKADGGEGGLGHTILRPGEHASPDDILKQLQANPFLNDDLIVVEEFIHSSEMLSPSLEFFVPPPGQGKPEITYLSNQLFLEFGDFLGVLLSRELLEAPWYPVLAESGQAIAERLQSMGYVGHFDLDAIVDDHQRVFLLEINSRRTGGTHVHEFASFLLGPNYLDEVVLLSNNRMSSGVVSTWEDLLEAIGDLLYPRVAGGSLPHPPGGGVVVTATSALPAHEFGCIIVAATTAEALALQRVLEERLTLHVRTGETEYR